MIAWSRLLVAEEIPVEGSFTVLQFRREARGCLSYLIEHGGEALVVDFSRNLNKVIAVDPEARRAEVQPGVVLDHLNAQLKAHGLWFPVDVSTSAQATLGGMAGNNSCGSRSIAYGNMVHNVLGIDAVLADGTREHFGAFGVNGARSLTGSRSASLVSRLFEIGAREREEIERVWPRVMRRVGGYNLDVFHPQSERPYTADGSVNLAHLLVGSEGTLATFRRLHLALSPLPSAKVLGVINFPDFHAAMASAQHIVRLGPVAVELVDRTMIDLARANPAFRAVIDSALVRRDGELPQAVLLVEFAGDDRAAITRRHEDCLHAGRPSPDGSPSWSIWSPISWACPARSCNSRMSARRRHSGRCARRV